MKKYRVWVTEEIMTTYEIEAKSASSAIDMVKNQGNAPDLHRTLKQNYRTEVIKEEN